MKKATPIDENDLSDVSGGVSSAGKLGLAIDESCEEWKCNICSSGLRCSFLGSQAPPSCRHYAFTSCRNCGHLNAQSNTCGKKI